MGKFVTKWYVYMCVIVVEYTCESDLVLLTNHSEKFGGEVRDKLVCVYTF